jgi:hypothetical protein
MTDVSSLWSDEINAFVDAAFDSGIVSRNPSDAEQHTAYRYAIKLAIDESRQSQTDALKKARGAINGLLDIVSDYNLDSEQAGRAFAALHEIGTALAALGQSK